MGKFYFAIKDGWRNAETGEPEDAAVKITSPEITRAEEAKALVMYWNPEYEGRLREITEEEYIRDYGDDEDES